MIDFCIIKQKITENYDTHLSNLEDSWKDFTGAYLDESFLIDFITDSPEAEYGIYALRYSQNNDDSTIIIHISKENNVYKIDEVTNYR